MHNKKNRPGTPKSKGGLWVLTVSETADRLATTSQTVFNLIRQGILDPVIFPGRKRLHGVSGDSLTRLIESSTRLNSKK